jgi:hypothetical protein
METGIDCGGADCKVCKINCDPTKPNYCSLPECYSINSQCTTNIALKGSPGTYCKWMPHSVVEAPPNPGGINSTKYCAIAAYDCNVDGKKESLTPCGCTSGPQINSISYSTGKFIISWIQNCEAEKSELYRCINPNSPSISIQPCGANGENAAAYVLVGEISSSADAEDATTFYSSANYWYKIKDYFANGIEGYSPPSSFLTGDEVCYGKTTSNTFCLGPSNAPPGITYFISDEELPKYIFSCDSSDHVITTPKDCSVDEQNKPVQARCWQETSTSAICAENDPDICSACNDPLSTFGLPQLSVASWTSGSGPTVHSNELCSSAPFCYYDQSSTVANKYFSCDYGGGKKVGSCYDYQSKGACEENKCLEGSDRCEWHDISTTLGTGVCVEKDIEAQQCDLCMGNKGYTTCTPDICQKYGTTMIGGKSSCLAFDSNNDGILKGAQDKCIGYAQATCMDYPTKDFCLGTTAQWKGAAKNTSINTTWKLNIKFNGTNSIKRASKDYFGLGLCTWNPLPGISPHCYKDADNNTVQDSNQIDRYKPNSTVLVDGPIPNFQFNVVVDDLQPDGKICTSTDATSKCSGVKTFYYCIRDGINKPCYPKDRDLKEVTIPSNTRVITIDEPLDLGKNYTFSYFAEDYAQNLEVVKNKTIEVKIDPPRITRFEVYPSLDESSPYTESNVTVLFWLSKVSECSDDLDYSGAHLHSIPQSPLGANRGDFFQTKFTKLLDGEYPYTINCKNDFGRMQNVSKIKINANKKVFGWYPKGPTEKKSINLSIEIRDDVECRYKETTVDFIFATGALMNGRVVNSGTFTKYKENITLPANRTYHYAIKCNFIPQSLTMADFTLDRIKPMTVATTEAEGSGLTYNFGTWQTQHDGIFLSCVDTPVNGFGCYQDIINNFGGVLYCINATKCEPNTVYQPDYNPVPTIRNQKYLCVKSVEQYSIYSEGGKWESTRCFLVNASFFRPRFIVESLENHTSESESYLTNNKGIDLNITVANYAYDTTDPNADAVNMGPWGKLYGVRVGPKLTGARIEKDFAFKNSVFKTTFNLTNTTLGVYKGLSTTKTMEFLFRYRNATDYYAGVIEGGSPPTNQIMYIRKLKKNVISTIGGQVTFPALGKNGGMMMINATGSSLNFTLYYADGTLAAKTKATDIDFTNGTFGIKPDEKQGIDVKEVTIFNPSEYQSNIAYIKHMDKDGAVLRDISRSGLRSFRQSLSLKNGTNAIEIKAQDKTGNELTKTYYVKYFGYRPQVSQILVNGADPSATVTEYGQNTTVTAYISVVEPDLLDPRTKIKQVYIKPFGTTENLKLLSCNKPESPCGDGIWEINFNASKLGARENTLTLYILDGFGNSYEPKFNLTIADTHQAFFVIKFLKNGIRKTNLTYGRYNITINASEEATIRQLNISNDFGGVNITANIDRNRDSKMFWNGSFTVPRDGSYYERKGNVVLSLNAVDANGVNTSQISFYKNEPVVIDTIGPSPPIIEPTFFNDGLEQYDIVYSRRVRQDSGMFYTNKSSIYITGYAPNAKFVRMSVLQPSESHKDNNVSANDAITTNPKIISTNSLSPGSSNSLGNKTVLLNMPSANPLWTTLSSGTHFIGFPDHPRKSYGHYNEYYEIQSANPSLGTLKLKSPLDDNVGNTEARFYNAKLPSYSFGQNMSLSDGWNQAIFQASQEDLSISTENINIFYDDVAPELYSIENPKKDFTTNIAPQNITLLVKDSKLSSGILNATIIIKDKDTNSILNLNDYAASVSPLEEKTQYSTFTIFFDTSSFAASFTKGNYTVIYKVYDNAQNGLSGSFDFSYNDKTPYAPDFYLLDNNFNTISNPDDLYNDGTLFVGTIAKGFPERPLALLNFSRESGDIKIISITSSPNVPVKYQNYSIGAGKISNLSLDTTTEGLYSLTIRARRSAESEIGTYRYYLIIDKTKPNIAALELRSPIGTKFDDGQINATVDNELFGYKYKLYVDNSLKESSDAFGDSITITRTDLPLLPEPSHTIKLNVTDQAGNSQTGSGALIIDNKDPEVNLTNVTTTHGKVIRFGRTWRTNASIVDLTIKHNEAKLKYACYSNANDALDRLSACDATKLNPVTNSFRFQDVGIITQQGDDVANNFTIFAEDMALNIGNFSKVIYTDLKAPTITNLDDFKNLIEGNSKPSIPIIFDEKTYVRKVDLYLVNDSGKYKVDADLSSTADKLTYNLISKNNLQDGRYEIEITFEDELGNSESRDGTDLWFNIEKEPGSGITSITLSDIDPSSTRTEGSTERGHDTEIKANVVSGSPAWTNRYVYVMLYGSRYDLAPMGSTVNGDWLGTLDTKSQPIGIHDAEIVVVDSQGHSKSNKFSIIIKDSSLPNFKVMVFDSDSKRTTDLRIGHYTIELEASELSKIQKLNMTFDYKLTDGKSPRPIQIYWTKYSGPRTTWTGSFTIPREYDYVDAEGNARFNILGLDEGNNNGTFIEEADGGQFRLNTKGPSPPIFEPSFETDSLVFYGMLYPSYMKAYTEGLFTNKAALFVSGHAPGAKYVKVYIDSSNSDFTILPSQVIGSDLGITISAAAAGESNLTFNTINNFSIIKKGNSIRFVGHDRESYRHYKENYRIESVKPHGGVTDVVISPPLEQSIANGEDIIIYNNKYAPEWFGLDTRQLEIGKDNKLYAISRSYEDSYTTDLYSIFMDNINPEFEAAINPKDRFTVNAAPATLSVIVKDKIPSSGIIDGNITLKNKATGTSVLAAQLSRSTQVASRDDYKRFNLEFDMPFLIPEGNYIAAITAGDRSGNHMSTQYEFYYSRDTPSGPMVNILNDNDSVRQNPYLIETGKLFSNSSKVRLLANFSSNVDSVTVQSVVSSPALNVQQSAHGTNSFLLDFGQNVVEGDYLVTLTANLLNHAETGTYTFTLIVDKTRPGISNILVSSPVNQNSTNVYVNATITGESHPYSGKVKIINATKVEASGNFMSLADYKVRGLADGSYPVRINITDQAGNTATATGTIQIDNKMPVFNITDIIVTTGSRRLGKGAIWRLNDANPKLMLNYYDMSSLLYACYENMFLPGIRCGATKLFNPASAFQMNVNLGKQDLDEVPNKIIMTGQDRAMNKGATNFTLSVDLRPPQIIDYFTKHSSLIYNPMPYMFVKFDEPAIIDGFSLYQNTSTQMKKLNSTKLGVNTTYFTFSSVNKLPNGSYVLNITYEDAIGNKDYAEFRFFVNIKPTNITFVNPRYGYTPVDKFDFIIATSQQATCRFTKKTNPNIDINSFDLMNNSFTSDYTGKLHKFKNFTMSVNGIRTSRVPLWIRCRDKFGFDSEPVYTTFTLDSVPPKMTASFNPNPILESTDVSGEFKLVSTLNILTDKAAFCRYWQNSFLIKLNGDNTTSHSAQIINNQITSGVGYYSYNLSCSSLANITSYLENTTLNVNLNETLKIGTISPADQSYVSGDFDFNVSTNKLSNCYYTIGGQETSFSGESASSLREKHRANVQVGPEGIKRYSIRCERTNSGSKETATKVITLMADFSAPNMTAINASYCSNSITMGWDASESISTPVSFNYTVTDSNGTVIIPPSVTGSKSRYVSGLSIDKNKQYTIIVNAINSLGMVSHDSSAPVTDAIGSKLCGYTNGTDKSTCENGVRDGSETDIDCGGVCSGCGPGDKCKISNDCASGYCDQVNGTCQASLCENSKKDSSNDETDIDCGGNKCSERCKEGKKCDENNDCESSLNCKDSKCTRSTCIDNLKGINEADVDCGGVCLNQDKLCVVGQMCLDDTDCQSNYCRNGICTAASCSDGKENQDETDTDCGGATCEQRCDTGKKCKEDTDCGTNLFCKNNLCDSTQNKDSDKDGIPDYWEVKYDLDPNDPSDAEADKDGEGLVNLDEFKHNTKPDNKDTDGDGWTDKQEIDTGTDPLDPANHPESNFLRYLLYSLLVLLVLGGGGYLGYTEYADMKRKKQQPKSPSMMQKQEQKPAQKPFARLQPPPLRPLAKQQQPIKKPELKPEQKPAEEESDEGWLQVQAPKEQPNKGAFDKLQKLTENVTKTTIDEKKDDKKNAFEQLKRFTKKKK